MKFIHAHQMAKNTSGKRQQRITGVPVDQPVVEAAARLGDGDDERQVEEQLQRGGRPVFLVGVAGRHRCEQRHVGKSPAPLKIG